MSGPLSRQEASRVLGVPTTADHRAVKQAYRRLAREHHPDRGGDPGTFHRLQRAYERLVDGDAPAPPSVARGRPSRPPTPFASEHERADVTSIAWDRPPDDAPGARGLRLDRDRLAVLLARDGTGDVARLTATSRAPASRLNGLAASLSPTFTTWLVIGPASDDRGRAVVRVELVARGRRARGALDRADVDGRWTRTRGSSSTSLRTSLEPSPDRRATAVRVTDAVERLLDGLSWPLGEWTVTDEGR